MDERIDLTVLELDGVRRELLVAAIMANAAPELARRQALDVSPMLMISDWLRPALAAAAIIALLAVSVLSLDLTDRAPAGSLAAALAVPEPADAWLVGERAPTVGDVLIAMEREAR
jgi:hypothetical protein